MPDSLEYGARLKSYIEGKDPLAMQEAAPKLLAQLINRIPDETLRAKPAPDKWSIAEILAHLADDEIVTSWRYRQMIENSGCTMAGFDQDEWARVGDNASRDSRQSLQLFQLLRDANLHMLRRLAPEEWQRH